MEPKIEIPKNSEEQNDSFKTSPENKTHLSFNTFQDLFL